MLEFARGDIHLNPEEVQINDWLDSIADILWQNMSKADIHLRTEYKYTGKVWIDQEKMRRVVMNIISNARDAMPEGGLLTISTAREGDNWRIGLHDTGTGIPMEQRPKIFDLFASFGKKNGTGLGLAMVMDIMQGHGGSVRFESCVAGENGNGASGTSFFLCAPIPPTGAEQRKDHQRSERWKLGF